jgi:hypothetical protein
MEGDRRQATGDRQQATGDKQQATGDKQLEMKKEGEIGWREDLETTRLLDSKKKMQMI